ncbi:MAG: zf-HC2 domain-containing protein, partial [Planctomycetes bacterium]|nr:zf-HC2 domain-containing protein [Planctomycetota bacterium]
MTGEASRRGANGNCNGWSERVTRLVVDEITPDELRELERHLRSCEDCRASLARREEVVALLRRSAGSDARLSVARRSAIEAAAGGSARSGSRRWLGTASAAALLLLGAMIWVLAPDGSEERQLAQSREEEHVVDLVGRKQSEVGDESTTPAPAANEAKQGDWLVVGGRRMQMKSIPGSVCGAGTALGAANDSGETSAPPPASREQDSLELFRELNRNLERKLKDPT